MKRRAKGTGTVEATRDGRSRARFPFETGKRETVGIFATEEEAHAALDALCAEMNDAGIGRGGHPLKGFVEKMFQRHRDAGYSAVDGDEDRWRTYFAGSELEAWPVESLECSDVLDAIGALRKKRAPAEPLSLSSRKALLNIVRGALKLAVAAGKVSRNVLIGAQFDDPKGKAKKARRKVKKRALAWEQYEALRRVAGVKWYELVVAIWTCCRQGELRALHWVDVHNVSGSACTCDERRSDPHVRIRYGRPPVVGEDCSPKSGEERCVSLFGAALAAFEEMPRSATGIVFPSRLKGYRAKGRLVGRKWWKTVKEAAGLPALHWHDLRHTGLTWLVRGELRMGITGPWPLEAAKEHAGHSEVRTTELYADQREGAMAQEHASRARGDKPATSPQALAQLLSHLGDLNPRPTVYESGYTSAEAQGNQALAGLAWAYVDAVTAGDELAHRHGLAFAAAYLRSVGTEMEVAHG